MIDWDKPIEIRCGYGDNPGWHSAKHIYNDPLADSPHSVLDMETHYMHQVSNGGRDDGICIIRNVWREEKPAKKKKTVGASDVALDFPEHELEHGIDGWAGVARFNHWGTHICSTRGEAVKNMEYLAKQAGVRGADGKALGKMYLMHVTWDVPDPKCTGGELYLDAGEEDAEEEA
jgi:hypothetical protein